MDKEIFIGIVNKVVLILILVGGFIMRDEIILELKDSGRKLKNVPFAVFKPFTTFENLGKSFPFLLIVSLFFFRILHTFGHYGVIHFQWAMQRYDSFFVWAGDFFRPFRAIHFIYLFMLSSVFIYLIGKKFGTRKAFNYETVEEGIFYIMLTPILLLFIFGIPHLWFDPALHDWYIWGMDYHIPLFITFILMPLQGSFLLKKVWGLDWKYGFPLFLAIPIWVKYRPAIIGLIETNILDYIALDYIVVQELFYIISSLVMMSFYFRKDMWKRFYLLLVIFGVGMFFVWVPLFTQFIG